VKVKSIIAPAFILLTVILFNSCNWNFKEKYGPYEYNPYASGVFYGNNKFPIRNQEITIDNRTVITDINGRFSISHLPNTFDIQLKDTARNYYIIYKNVTTYDSYYFHLPVETGNPSDQYVIAVQCPGLPAGTKAKIYFAARGFGPCILTFQELDSSSFIVFNAPQNTPISGYVELLTYTEDNNGNISSYGKFASTDVIPVPGSTAVVTFTSSDFNNVSTTQVNCVLNSSHNYTSINTDLVFNYNYYRSIYYDNKIQSIRNFNTNNFTLVLPSYTPYTYFKPALLITTEGPEGITQETKLVTEGSTITINLTALPSVVSPENYATNIDINTVFSFQKLQTSGVLIFTLIDPADNKSYNLCTSDDNITLKSLSPLVTLEPNKTYAYRIEQVGLKAKTVSEYIREQDVAPSYSGKSPVRHFTTKP
jgi:hypothetical protein